MYTHAAVDDGVARLTCVCMQVAKLRAEAAAAEAARRDAEQATVHKQAELTCLLAQGGAALGAPGGLAAARPAAPKPGLALQSAQAPRSGSQVELALRQQLQVGLPGALA